ncbi:unnamed protein product, partial [Ectocarpus sp. 12 AP-2014]
QVVRADLKELWDLDLQGAPYGYTPFCSSREETLGYQFWRGGFWQAHLAGRPYHISALYVVDLKAFRRMAVGDSLRSIYNSLSQDPNSLSNLDQDLPNYAQIRVRGSSVPRLSGDAQAKLSRPSVSGAGAVRRPAGVCCVVVGWYVVPATKLLAKAFVFHVYDY